MRGRFALERRVHGGRDDLGEWAQGFVGLEESYFSNTSSGVGEHKPGHILLVVPVLACERTESRSILLSFFGES